MPAGTLIQVQPGESTASFKKRWNKRKQSSKKQSFDQRVLTVINRTQETKKAVFQSSFIAFNSPITATSDVLRIMPDIPTGSNSWQRTGQSIRLTKLVIRGYITTTGPATTSPNRARYGVRHLILADKQKNDWQQVDSFDLGGLLEGVSSAGQYMDGTVGTYMTPVNRENFTQRMDKKFPITQIYEEGDAGKAAGNNGIKFFTKILTFGKNGKELYFEGSNHPINFKYFMSLGYCYLDGTAPDTVSTDIKMQYTATAYYKDA